MVGRSSRDSTLGDEANKFKGELRDQVARASELAALDTRGRELVEASWAEGTNTQYQSHFTVYRRFCIRLDLPIQLGHSLMRFLSWRVMTGKKDGSRLSFETIKVQKSAVVTSLQKIGHPAPQLDWGFRRFVGRPQVAKRPISPADLYQMYKVLMGQKGAR